MVNDVLPGSGDQYMLKNGGIVSSFEFCSHPHCPFQSRSCDWTHARERKYQCGVREFNIIGDNISSPTTCQLVLTRQEFPIDEGQQFAVEISFLFLCIVYPFLS